MFKEYPLCSSVEECLASELATLQNYNHTGDFNFTTFSPAYGLYNSSTVPTELPEGITKPNTALLTFMLVIGTFVIAYTLKGLRNKKYFGRTVSVHPVFAILVHTK